MNVRRLKTIRELFINFQIKILSKFQSVGLSDGKKSYFKGLFLAKLCVFATKLSITYIPTIFVNKIKDIRI